MFQAVLFCFILLCCAAGFVGVTARASELQSNSHGCEELVFVVDSCRRGVT